MTASISTPNGLNSLEVIQVVDYMDKNYPQKHYNVAAGNDCIWVYWGSTIPINLYFIFRNGKIVDVQID